MFRSAIVRSLRASAPRVIKTPAPFQIRSSPIAVPQFTPSIFQGARLYSAPAGLSKDEAEGRIVNLLKNFDKVRHIVLLGIFVIHWLLWGKQIADCV
jgi:NADH dehydrogenase (ubiquinone) 1 alpha/beta subcomplex 1